MGNKTSSPKEPVEITGFKFGSIYPNEGKVRPGYYFGNGKIMYKGLEIIKMPMESDFQKLKYGYLKSNLRVFYHGKDILGANPATFLTITRNNVGNLSKNNDKNQTFKKLNSVLGMDFIGNQKRIYFKDKVIHTE